MILRLVTECTIYCIIIIGGLDFDELVKEKTICCRIMAECLGQETGSFVVMTWSFFALVMEKDNIVR